MRRVNLDAVELEPSRGHTSKGDQPKWHMGDWWYKADHMGYEGLAEVVVSRILEKSNVREFVRYRPVTLECGGRELVGCESKNFRQPNEMLIPLERLHRAYRGWGLAEQLAQMVDVGEQIEYTVSFVERTTGLSEVGAYVTLLLELDAVFLNEDRHTNNLAVLRNETTKQFRLCPAFDHGLSLLSDLHDYPLEADSYACMQRVKAKPFSRDFDQQVDAAEQRYGIQFKCTLSPRSIPELLEDLVGCYPRDYLQRVEQILYQQMRKYGVYFEK